MLEPVLLRGCLSLLYTTTRFNAAAYPQVKFREFLSTEYGEAQLDFLLEAMKLEKLDAGEQDQAATKVRCSAAYLPAFKGCYVIEEENASWNLIASPLSLAKVNARELFLPNAL